MAFVTTQQARLPAAFCTLFAILSSSSVSELDSLTDEDLVSKMYQAPSWGSSTPVKVLKGTARKANQRSFESRLSDVGDEVAFDSAELDVSPETVELTFEAAVQDLRTSMPDDVDFLPFVISEWPKVVESVSILRAQVRLARELQGDASVGFSELIVGLDDKLAFLKGCVGSLPMAGPSMFDHGLDLPTAAEGVSGSIAVIKDSIAKLLSNDSDISGRVCLLESMLSDTGEFVGLILDLASRLHALEIFHPPVAGGVSGFGVRELELRLDRVERDLTDQKPSPTLHLTGKESLSRLCWIACPVWKPLQWKNK